MDKFDLIIIGAGPGGYVCAIRAAQLGKKVAIIEKDNLGGTCLNIGCIPSKFLLHASDLYLEAKLGHEQIGISQTNPKIQLSKLHQAKQDNINLSKKGIEGLFKKNKITLFRGVAKIIENVEQVEVLVDKQKLFADKLVIATGSYPISLPKVKIDEDKILSSTGALTISKVPKKLIIIGAGVIGLELGLVWQNLGAKIEVIEALPRAIPNLDLECVNTLISSLKKKGMDFVFDARVDNISINKNKTVDVSYQKDGKKINTSADHVLVAIGRAPLTEGLNLIDMKIATDDKGFIKVDQNFETNVNNIYAIGDVIGGMMLAHKAEEEGIALAEHLASQEFYINHNNIPSVVYTSPELAYTGMSEEEVKAASIEYKVGKFPFMANGKARATLKTEGMVKLIADKQTGRLLGAGIVGESASSLIHELVLAIEFGANYKDISLTSHAHPSLSEAIKEAALALGDGAIHI